MSGDAIEQPVEPQLEAQPARRFSLPEPSLYNLSLGMARQFSACLRRLDARGQRIAVGHLAHAEVVDGMDVVAVEAAARRAVQRIHETGGPVFLECRTYRFRAHSMSAT